MHSSSQDNEEIFLEDEKMLTSINYPSLNKPIKKTSIMERIFEASLTYEQYQVIKMRLPKGYSLKEKKKKKKMSFSITPGTKKVHFESKVTVQKPPQKLQTPKKTNFIHKTEMVHAPVPIIKQPQPDMSILNEPISDQEYKKITMALKNFKTSNDAMKKCFKILLILKIHPKAKPFLEPVDPVALKIPDYPLIVKEPMDLGTIEKKLRGEVYKDPSEFEQDVNRVWNNSLLYNPKTTKIHGITLEMKMYFEQLLKESRGEKKKEPGVSVEKKIEKLLGNLENMYKRDQTNLAMVFKNKVAKLANIPFNVTDRKKLIQNLMQISQVEMAGVLEIVNEGNFDKNREKKEVELDLNSMNNEKLRMLEGYMDFIEKTKRLRLEDKEKKRQRDGLKKKILNPEQQNQNNSFSSTNSSFITNSNVSEEEMEFK